MIYWMMMLHARWMACMLREIYLLVGSIYIIEQGDTAHVAAGIL
jgi:hypothetical protein